MVRGGDISISSAYSYIRLTRECSDYKSEYHRFHSEDRLIEFFDVTRDDQVESILSELAEVGLIRYRDSKGRVKVTCLLNKKTRSAWLPRLPEVGGGAA